MITSKKIGKESVNKYLPFLQLISIQNNLKLNRSREFNICKEILIRSLIRN